MFERIDKGRLLKLSVRFFWFCVSFSIVLLLSLVVVNVAAEEEYCSEWSPTWCMQRASSSGLVEGWNLIGYCGEPLMASEYAFFVDNCVMVSGFDAVSQSYYSYFVGGASSFDFEICCGMGVFVFVE